MSKLDNFHTLGKMLELHDDHINCECVVKEFVNIYEVIFPTDTFLKDK